MTENAFDDGPCVVLCRISVNDGTVMIAASLSILVDFTWQVVIEGRKIPPQHFGSVAVNCVSGVVELLRFIDTRMICCGNDDDKFLGLVNARKGKFKDNAGMPLCVYVCARMSK